MHISDILINCFPGAKYSVGETYESLDWVDDNIAKPTEQEINELSIQAEIIITQKKRANKATKLLSECDYMATADYEFTDGSYLSNAQPGDIASQWKIYRSELRNIARGVSQNEIPEKPTQK